MYLWFTIITPTTITFITSITGSITIAIVLLTCALRKSKRPYKPGHLPQFMDPNAKEADTYYGMRSTVAFPVKGTEIKRKYDLEEPQARADIESKDVQDREIQSESIPVRGSNKPVGLLYAK
ncbi:unnamed protein product [Onchocerca ochengi]|uniref:Cadherin_C domain-containing protein n=2 Tax=Onchocerca TaxID=6281 RepID=A0A182EJY0_ONCOC|nr:unnamed protein product [Onchocerca ochengi]